MEMLREKFMRGKARIKVRSELFCQVKFKVRLMVPELLCHDKKAFSCFWYPAKGLGPMRLTHAR